MQTCKDQQWLSGLLPYNVPHQEEQENLEVWGVWHDGHLHWNAESCPVAFRVEGSAGAGVQSGAAEVGGMREEHEMATGAGAVMLYRTAAPKGLELKNTNLEAFVSVQQQDSCIYSRFF